MKQSSRSLTRPSVFGLGLLALVVLLIGLGNVVTTTGSGMGCSDHWPSCNGQLIPDFTNYRVVIEFFHRMIAGIVGLLATGFCGWVWFGDYQTRQRISATVSFLLLLCTVALGALTVKLELSSPWVNVVHLSVSMAFLGSLSGTVSMITIGQYELESPDFQGFPETVFRRLYLALGFTYLQIVLGAYLRHHDGVLPVYRIPGLSELSLPAYVLKIPVVHLVVGILVVVLVMRAAKMVKTQFPSTSLATMSGMGIGFVHLQILLGFLSIIPSLRVFMTTGHVIVAALLILGLAWVLVQCHQVHLERSKHNQ